METARLSHPGWGSRRASRQRRRQGLRTPLRSWRPGVNRSMSLRAVQKQRPRPGRTPGSLLCAKPRGGTVERSGVTCLRRWRSNGSLLSGGLRASRCLSASTQMSGPRTFRRTHGLHRTGWVVGWEPPAMARRTPLFLALLAAGDRSYVPGGGSKQRPRPGDSPGSLRSSRDLNDGPRSRAHRRVAARAHAKSARSPNSHRADHRGGCVRDFGRRRNARAHRCGDPLRSGPGRVSRVEALRRDRPIPAAFCLARRTDRAQRVLVAKP